MNLRILYDLEGTCSTRAQALESLLLQIGFRHKLMGSSYLCKALEICCADPTAMRCKITQTLYPKVAEVFGTSPARVERDIRTAILDCYERGKLIEMNTLLGCNFIEKHYPPTNADLIMFLASCFHAVLFMHDDKDKR